MDTDRKIRCLQSRLYTSGMGTILFSLWSGIRDIQNIFTALREQPYLLDASVFSRKTFSIILGVLFFVVIGGSILIRTYIGRKAISASLGKKSGKAYLVLSVLLLLCSCAVYYSDLRNLSGIQLSRLKDIVLLVIDATANVILGEVVVYSLLLKRLRGKTCR